MRVEEERQNAPGSYAAESEEQEQERAYTRHERERKGDAQDSLTVPVHFVVPFSAAFLV